MNAYRFATGRRIFERDVRNSSAYSGLSTRGADRRWGSYDIDTAKRRKGVESCDVVVNQEIGNWRGRSSISRSCAIPSGSILEDEHTILSVWLACSNTYDCVLWRLFSSKGSTYSFIDTRTKINRERRFRWLLADNHVCGRNTGK